MQSAKSQQSHAPGFIDQFSDFLCISDICNIQNSRSRERNISLPKRNPEFEKKRGYDGSQVLLPKEKIGHSRKSLAQSVYTDPIQLQEPPIDSPRLPKNSGTEPPAFCAQSGKPVHVVTMQLPLKSKQTANTFSDYDK